MSRQLPDDINDLATKTTTAIGNVFLSVRVLLQEHAGEVDFSLKDDGTPLTKFDTEVERIILQSLKKDFPNVPIFAEETGYNESKLPETCLIIDPIDGTKSFIKNTGTFTCMSVLIHKGQAVSCVIYNPTTGDVYTATKDKGAYKNDSRLDLHTSPMPENALAKHRYCEQLNDLLKGHNITARPGIEGGGHGFAMVAEGSLAAAFKLASKGYLHDYATGALLVCEAGGSVIPIDTHHYTMGTRDFVACHPKLEPFITHHKATIRSIQNLV